jgi:anti-sigma regulatory factor (Ser/Thr protein kinase)
VSTDEHGASGPAAPAPPTAAALAAPAAPRNDGVASASWAADRRNIRAARAFVAGALRGWDALELSESAVLVVSELATNAVVHAGSDFRVTLQLLPEGLLLRVDDASSRQPTPRQHSSSRTDGRGLALLDGLCCGWGTVLDEQGGKSVWALVDTVSAARG